MTSEPLSKSLRPDVLRAQLAALRGKRSAVDVRRGLKLESGEDAAAENAELAKLDESIAALEQPLRQT
jgi:hypothetical protein